MTGSYWGCSVICGATLCRGCLGGPRVVVRSCFIREGLGGLWCLGYWILLLRAGLRGSSVSLQAEIVELSLEASLSGIIGRLPVSDPEVYLLGSM